MTDRFRRTGGNDAPNGQQPRVLLKSLGCRLNEAELESWAAGFMDLGYRIALDREPADLVVVNTCAVTQEATRKSRKLLRRAQRTNPAARLVVSGCLATLEARDLQGEEGVDLVVPNQDKDHLVAIATRTLALPVMPELATREAANPIFARGRQRAFIKVQDGCRHACTFCVTTRARGEERSRPSAEVVALVQRLVSAGVREVVLTGVHLGGYGSDIGGDLVGLIRDLLAHTEVARLRLGSLEPWNLPPDLWGLFQDPRLMPHLHLPMQSGSDAMLRRMARRCKTAAFTRLAQRAKAAVPGINLTTDIIVGFPGETESDWERTMAFVQTHGFGQVHIFAYSPRPGTRAVELPNPVDARTRERRSQELHALASKLRHERMASRIGQTAPILLEGGSRRDDAREHGGYTPDYLPIRVDCAAANAESGEIREVLISGLSPDGETLMGQVADRETTS